MAGDAELLERFKCARINFTSIVDVVAMKQVSLLPNGTEYPVERVDHKEQPARRHRQIVNDRFSSSAEFSQKFNKDSFEWLA